MRTIKTEINRHKTIIMVFGLDEFFTRKYPTYLVYIPYMFLFCWINKNITKRFNKFFIRFLLEKPMKYGLIGDTGVRYFYDENYTVYLIQTTDYFVRATEEEIVAMCI